LFTEPFIREKLTSGKLLIEWRHDLCAEVTKKRYINSDQELLKAAHAEIANLFFPQETSDESEDGNSDTSEKSGMFASPSIDDGNSICKMQLRKLSKRNC